MDEYFDIDNRWSVRRIEIRIVPEVIPPDLDQLMPPWNYLKKIKALTEEEQDLVQSLVGDFLQKALDAQK